MRMRQHLDHVADPVASQEALVQRAVLRGLAGDALAQRHHRRSAGQAVARLQRIVVAVVAQVVAVHAGRHPQELEIVCAAILVDAIEHAQAGRYHLGEGLHAARAEVGRQGRRHGAGLPWDEAAGRPLSCLPGRMSMPRRAVLSLSAWLGRQRQETRQAGASERGAAGPEYSRVVGACMTQRRRQAEEHTWYCHRPVRQRLLAQSPWPADRR